MTYYEPPPAKDEAEFNERVRRNMMEAQSPTPAAPTPIPCHICGYHPGLPICSAGHPDPDCHVPIRVALSHSAAELAEAQATIERLTRDKDHLLTADDGKYLRERLGEMAKMEAELAEVRRERDDLRSALTVADISTVSAQRYALITERDALAKELADVKSQRDALLAEPKRLGDVILAQTENIMGLERERDRLRVALQGCLDAMDGTPFVGMKQPEIDHFAAAMDSAQAALEGT